METEQIRNEKIILSEIKALNEEWHSVGRDMVELRKDLSALERQIEEKEKFIRIRKNTLDFLNDQKSGKWQEIEALPFELTEFGMGVNN
tara:strand:+ start:392 stop:658 length:267 start_codon:yes stop_codon:yes gene_type:complete